MTNLTNPQSRSNETSLLKNAGQTIATEIERFRGSLLSQAAGDSVGSAVEFMPRGSFPLVSNMRGGGPFSLKPGQWTDDMSMALCLGNSLAVCGGFDPRDQMERYLKWYESGYMSSTGACFDIGNITRQALINYKVTGTPMSGSSDPRSAGNGSIMRLAPVALFYFPNRESMRHFSAESSRTTHAAQECIEACILLADILFRALSGASKEDILKAEPVAAITMPNISAIARGEYKNKSRDQIFGTGYVVQSLEAALWSFWSSDSLEQAICTAANLGDDADTTAAICGQVAGAYYGESGIPSAWLEHLSMRNEIRELAEKLHYSNRKS